MAVETRVATGRLVLIQGKLALIPALALESLVFLSFFLLYFIGRGLGGDDVGLATANAERIIDSERALGMFWEPGMQRAILDNKSLLDVANFTYRFLHLPVVGVMGVLFFLTDLRKYRVLRNALLLSCIIGIPFYHLFPVTPPRLLADHGVDLGFVDTIGQLAQVKPGAMANRYAAVPSYHFGWIMLVAIGAAWCWRSRVLPVLALGFTILMSWAIIVTANHYILDMVAGGIAVGAALLVTYRFERWADAHPEAVSRFTFTVSGHRLPF
ncbi:MAG: phosphatase PAP2 family protein [Dehalococcoidia bacterium]